MRTLFSKLSLLFVALSLALVACDKAPIDEQKPVKFEITSEASVEIAAEGGELVIEYTIENPKKGASVMATTNATWISDNDTSYAEDGKIRLAVEANDKESSRMAKIEVRYDTVVKSVSIKQLGTTAANPNAPKVSLEGVPVNVPVEGGEFCVTYSVENAVEGVNAVPTTDAEWIENLAARNGEIRFNIAATELFEAREATVVVSYEGAEEVSFKVIQAGLIRPELYLNDTLEVAAAGGDYEISYAIVNEIAGEKLTLTADKEWITATYTPARYTINLSIEPNESPEPRVATITVEYLGVEPQTITVTQKEKGATTESVALEITSAMLAADYGSEVEIHFFSAEGKSYTFDILSGLVNGVLPNGLYSMDNGLLYAKYCIHESGNLNAKMKDASIEVIGLEKATRFDASWTYNDVVYTIEWEGAVIGFNYDYEEESDLENATMVEISSAKVNYDKAGEKQILFTAADEEHQFNFKHSDIAVSKPIPDGKYSIEEGTMNSRYCLHGYGWEDGEITTAEATIKNNDDNTTSFTIVWVYNAVTYAIDWTGAVEGFVYEDVAGQKLDFVPTHVEVSDAGFAGLYFYFYDANENELVFNYDSGKVYMPYINYDSTKLDISTDEYTFEYTDNGDGTYTYNARFVTLDDRIIEFASALPTTVS